MSQSTNSVIGADQPGLDARQKIEEIFDAVVTSHSGASTPSYAQAGIVWLDTSGGATAWEYKINDGSGDHTIFTLNTSSGLFSFNLDTVEIFQSSTPQMRLGNTGATTDEKYYAIAVNSSGSFLIQTINDSKVFGANAIGIFRTGTTVDEIEFNATDIDINATNTYISGVVEFTGNVEIASIQPKWQFSETDGAADNKNWIFQAASESFYFQVWDDALVSNSTWLRVDRTGTTVDEIELNATNIDINSTNTSSIVTGKQKDSEAA